MVKRIGNRLKRFPVLTLAQLTWLKPGVNKIEGRRNSITCRRERFCASTLTLRFTLGRELISQIELQRTFLHLGAHVFHPRFQRTTTRLDRQRKGKLRNAQNWERIQSFVDRFA